MFEKIKAITKKIKIEKPLILNLTNEVTINFVANGLLSLGASPIMSKAPQELEALIKMANAIVINLGTLDEAFVRLCDQACQLANQFKKNIILDPVGAGASAFRTESALQLLKSHRISIVRGNASEVMALSGMGCETKGVDNHIESEMAVDSAKILAETSDAIVLMSGKTDVVSDGEKIKLFDRGSHFMPMVTGTGCLLSAVVAAFSAVSSDRFEATSCAALFYGVCGEIAARNISGPGSFQLRFLDALHSGVLEHDYENK